MVTIHEKTEKSFNTLGLGVLLPDSCVVKEEVNGSYELEMSHPRDEDGKWKRIEKECIIYASTPRGKQPFRIYRAKPDMSGITVNARHIFYDLLDNQCSAISFSGAASNALTALQGAFAYAMPFSFDTDISLTGTLKTGRMNPVQALLSDDEEANSFVKAFGGELLRDGYNVHIKTAIGLDRGVTIRYGKNLIGLEVNEDDSDVKTRIMCYGSNGSAAVDSPYIGNYVYPKIYNLEDDGKTIAELKIEAQELFDGGIDVPLVNIKVDFVELSKTAEYADYAPLETVFLGDIVSVINQKMNFSKRARVISYEWDCLLGKYKEVELGDFMPTLASSITSGVKSGSLASAASVTASAVSAMLQTHINDKDNPHEVTAAQTGGSSGSTTDTDADAVLELLVEHENDKSNPHSVTPHQIGAASNPNLLDNWYFVDPINQRVGNKIVPKGCSYYSSAGGDVAGQTDGAYVATYFSEYWWTIVINGATYYVWHTDVAVGYSGGGYCIDRWKALSNINVTISANGMNLKIEETGYFTQPLEPTLKSFLTGKICTLSALMSDGTVWSDTAVFGVESFTIEIPSDSGLLFLYHNPNDNGIGIRCGNDSQIFAAVKLELGSQQTLARKEGDIWVLNDPPPNKQQELAKCKRYCVALNSLSTYTTVGSGWFSDDGTVAEIIVPFNNTMRAFPTVYLHGEMHINSPSTTVLCTEMSVYNIGAGCLNLHCVITGGASKEPCFAFLTPTTQLFLSADL